MPENGDSGKVAVVTGGSRGIGRSIALELARAGYDLAIHYRNSEAEAHTLAEEVKALSREAFLVQGDVAKFADAKRFAEATLQHWPELHLLVNNAGLTRDTPLAFMTENDWTEVIGTNLTGVFNVTRAFIYQFLRQRHGAIINITTMVAHVGEPSMSLYGSTKAAPAIEYTRSAAPPYSSTGKIGPRRQASSSVARSGSLKRLKTEDLSGSTKVEPGRRCSAASRSGLKGAKGCEAQFPFPAFMRARVYARA